MKLHHRGLYRIYSRNLTLAIYDETNNSFTGIREKFGHHYLDTETHHNQPGTKLGSAHPKAYIQQLPDNIPHTETINNNGRITQNQALYNWLQEQQKHTP